MGDIYSKRIILIVNNIDGDLTKICFYKLYINIKIVKNLCTKPMSDIITKPYRVHMNL